MFALESTEETYERCPFDSLICELKLDCFPLVPSFYAEKHLKMTIYRPLCHALAKRQLSTNLEGPFLLQWITAHWNREPALIVNSATPFLRAIDTEHIV